VFCLYFNKGFNINTSQFNLQNNPQTLKVILKASNSITFTKYPFSLFYFSIITNLQNHSKLKLGQEINIWLRLKFLLSHTSPTPNNRPPLKSQQL
jgi:hypothetical protein